MKTYVIMHEGRGRFGLYEKKAEGISTSAYNWRFFSSKAAAARYAEREGLSVTEL